MAALAALLPTLPRVQTLQMWPPTAWAQSPPRRRAEGGGRSNKRKRLQEESYVGVSIAQEYTKPMDLLIELLEEDMKSIKVTNKCLEAVNLGGHKLACTSEGKCTSSTASMHHGHPRPADHLLFPRSVKM